MRAELTSVSLWQGPSQLSILDWDLLTLGHQGPFCYLLLTVSQAWLC